MEQHLKILKQSPLPHKAANQTPGKLGYGFTNKLEYLEQWLPDVCISIPSIVFSFVSKMWEENVKKLFLELGQPATFKFVQK